MLERVKQYLGIQSTDEKDNVLEELIAISSDEFKDITHLDDVVESIIIQMVVYRYNRLKTEGLESESYTGINLHYTVDYPDNLRKQIISHRKIRVVQ